MVKTFSQHIVSWIYLYKLTTMEQAILEKSTTLFMEKGFKTITMDDIANELTISKKTIYQFYPSKTDLIEKSLNFINLKLANELKISISKKKKAIQELIETKEMIKSLLNLETSNHNYQLQKYYPKLAQKQKSIYKKRYAKLLEGNLKKGIKEGVFREDIDIEFYARFHIASASIIDDADFFPMDDFEYNYLQNIHLENLIRMIGTEKGLNQYKELK